MMPTHDEPSDQEQTWESLTTAERMRLLGLTIPTFPPETTEKKEIDKSQDEHRDS